MSFLRMRRKFVGGLLVPSAWSGTMFPRAITVNGTGGEEPPAEDYAFMDSPVGYTDHWVYNGSTSGSGSELSPWTIAQFLAFNPSGGRHRVIMKPGRYNITTAAADSKMPVWELAGGGTAANPYLIKAQFPATNSSTTAGQLTIIDRTAGSGSLMGTANNGGIKNHVRVDGLKFEGGHGGNGNENAHIVLRSCNNWWFTRFWIDGLSEDTTSQPSTNGGGLFAQGVSSLFFRDFIMDNLGNPSTSTKIWQGVELYDATDCDFSYFTLRNIWGIGVHMKGAPNVQFVRNRIHHGYIFNPGDGGLNPYDVEAGTNTANHNFWWNIVVDGNGLASHCAEFNVIGGPHRGTHFQNITMRRSRFGALMFRPVAYSDGVTIRNCVFDMQGIAGQHHIEFLDALYPMLGNDQIIFNYNRYNNGIIMESGSGTDTTLAQWRSRSGEDMQSDETTHTYAGGGSFITHASVPADRPDTWGLYGPAGALVPVGCFQPAGHRTTV
jgi:hypothetical protein